MGKWFPGILFFFMLALVSAHSLWPDTVTLGWEALVILALLAVLALAPILATAEIPGLATLVFRQQVKHGEETTAKVEREAAELAEQTARSRTDEAGELFSAEVAPEEASTTATELGSDGAPQRGWEPTSDVQAETPDVQSVVDLFKVSAVLRNLLPRDPNLALAGLRLAIEEGVRDALAFLEPESTPTSGRLPLGRAVRRLHDVSAMTDTQAQLLLVIVELCNKAVHGQRVAASDAANVFDMADTLNRSFTLGYSLNFRANPHWHEQGLLCQYEHCVEHLPLTDPSTDASCPLFGHDCPGGQGVVDSCDLAEVNRP